MTIILPIKNKINITAKICLSTKTINELDVIIRILKDLGKWSDGQKLIKDI